MTQTVLEKNFTVEHKGRTYNVNFLDSDGQVLGLLNRDIWDIYDEEGEELNIYVFKDTTKKELKQIEKNLRLHYKLINFCTKHFNDYNPKNKLLNPKPLNSSSTELISPL